MTVGELIAALSHRDPSQALAISSMEELFIVPSKEAKLGVMKLEADDKLSPPLRLKGGSLVCAKTGGPLMTIEDIRSDGIAAVVWFNDGKCYRDAIHPDSLNFFIQVE